MDEQSFDLAIFELKQGPVRFHQDRLESLFLNPLVVEDRITSNSDLDPDFQFFLQRNSQYYITDQFNELTTRNYYNSSLSLLHLNIRSINQNISKLTDFLSTLEFNFSIIGISETWLDGNKQPNEYINMEGYNFIQESRLNRTGGGVGLFISNDIVYKLRPDLIIFDSQIMESIFVEIIRPKQSNIIVGNIYRPPNSNLQMFIDNTNRIMAKITTEQKDSYLMGDFNIDLLKYQQHNGTNDFLDTMFSHSFLPSINRATRITSHTATSIDNIFSNRFIEHDQSISGILFIDISDHLPIFSLLPHNSVINTKPVKLTKRMVNSQTKKEFSKALDNCNWDNVLSNQNPNIAYDNFVSTYNQIYEKCFPVKVLTRKKAKLSTKPWITKGLLVSIKSKAKLYKEFLRHPLLAHENKYKKFKNKLNCLLKISKGNYYDTRFENSTGNLRATWKLLNQIINRKVNKPKIPTTFMIIVMKLVIPL